MDNLIDLVVDKNFNITLCFADGTKKTGTWKMLLSSIERYEKLKAGQAKKNDEQEQAICSEIPIIIEALVKDKGNVSVSLIADKLTEKGLKIKANSLRKNEKYSNVLLKYGIIEKKTNADKKLKKIKAIIKKEEKTKQQQDTLQTKLF